MAGQGSRCSNDAVSVARDSARKFRLNFGRISKTFSLSFFYSPLLNPRAHDETTEGGTVYNHVGRGGKSGRERERKKRRREKKRETSKSSEIACFLIYNQAGPGLNNLRCFLHGRIHPPPPNEQVGGDVTPRKDSIEGSEHFYPYFSRFSRSPLSRVRREGKNYYLVNGTIDSDYSWASSIPDTGRYWLH